MTVREFAEKYKLEIVAGNNLDVELMVFILGMNLMM